MVSRSLYQMGVMSVITAVLWVGVGVYMALVRSASPSVEKGLLEPVSPTIDQTVLESLSTRLKVNTEMAEVMAPSPEATVSADEIVTPPSEASPSAQENDTIDIGGV